MSNGLLLTGRVEIILIKLCKELGMLLGFEINREGRKNIIKVMQKIMIVERFENNRKGRTNNNTIIPIMGMYRVIFLHFPTEKLKYLGIYSTDFNQFCLILISG